MILAFIKTYLLWIKIGAGIAIMLGAWWWYRHQMTVQFEKGQAAGQVELFKEQAATIEKQRVEAQADIDKQRAELDATREAMASERTALNTQRRQITATLNQSLGAIAGQESTLRNEIFSTADSGVIARYRLALDRARTAERQRPSAIDAGRN